MIFRAATDLLFAVQQQGKELAEPLTYGSRI
jgi:hypothetical protein